MVDRRPVNEDSILLKIRNWCYSTHTNSTLFGIGDDAAGIQPSGRPLLFCSDMSIQNVHFNLDYSTPSDVGHKSLARVLSDLAAMGAEPTAVTVSIAIPKDWPLSTIENFLTGYYEGAVAISRALGAPIVGGDLTRISGPLSIDVSAIGETRSQAKAWRRSGACPRDLVFVTGPLGGAAYALEQMNAGRMADLPEAMSVKHLRPNPRFDVGERFVVHPVHAAIDISDGLVRDALRLCTESNVSMVLDETRIPLIESSVDITAEAALKFALGGGDDYELLLVVAPDWAESPFGTTELRAIGATAIGKIEASAKREHPEVYVTDNSGSRRLAASSSLIPVGHDPFRDK